jgi:hypothetical protein
MNDEEKNGEETETLDFTNPDYVFIPKGNCKWRQQGYYLVCKSCEITHAVWIGPDKIMVGEDEKGPILKPRSFVRG